MATPYLKTKDYRFTLKVTVSVDGMRLSRTETHEAKGEILNSIVEKDGPDAIDTAERI